MGYYDWYNDPKYKPDATRKSGYWKDWWGYGNDDPYTSYASAYSYTYTYKDKTKTPEEILADTNRKICEEALRTIARSANVILNAPAEEGEASESVLYVKYSNAESVNNLGDSTIYISPDMLLGAATPGDKSDVVDAICGEVMLSAQLRRQVDAYTYKMFLNSKDHDVKSLWSAIEFAIARGDIVKEWEGFKPYFDTYADVKDKCSSTVLKRMLSQYNGESGKITKAAAFIKGVAWNLYHSSTPVKIPVVYRAGKALIAEGLDGAETSQLRWEMVKNVVKKLRKMYDEEEEAEDEEGMTYAGAPGALMEAGPDSKFDDGTGSSKFKGIDSTLFGIDAVGNKSCKSAADIASLSGESASEMRDSTSAPNVRNKGGRDISAIPVWVAADKLKAKVVAGFRAEKLRGIIESLKDAFAFKAKTFERNEFGKRSGKLSPNALYKIATEQDTLFSRKVIADTEKIAVCILLDQSGSMSEDSGSGSKMNQAADVAYIIAEVCKSIRNLELSVVGFSANDGSREARVLGVEPEKELSLRDIYDSSIPTMNTVDILAACPHNNNTDGFALWYAARHLADERPEFKRKILIMISDGQPNASGYGGDAAHDHVASCKRDAKNRFGVETYAIGVANAYTQELGDKMYGKGNNIVIKDVMSSAQRINRFLAATAAST